MSKTTTLTPTIPNKVLLGAIDAVKKDYCPTYFKGRKPTPDRLFCRYDSPQDEAMLKSNGLTLDDSDEPSDNTYNYSVIPLSHLRMDDSLNRQDRRDLDDTMIRRQTMESFTANGEDVDAPAIIVRRLSDNTYQVGGGRHRGVWSAAIGCKNVRALVVNTDDETWDEIQRQANLHNGAQLTEAERLVIVHNKVMKGGNGSKRQLCISYGVSERKYDEFAKQARTTEAAATKGLKVAPTVPTVLVERVLQATNEKKLTVEKAQELINAATPPANKPAVPKREIDRLTEPLKGAAPLSEEDTADMLKNLQGATAKAKPGKRGPNKTYLAKLSDAIKSAADAVNKRSPHEMGLAAKQATIMLARIEGVVAWLKAAAKQQQQ